MRNSADAVGKAAADLNKAKAAAEKTEADETALSVGVRMDARNYRPSIAFGMWQ